MEIFNGICLSFFQIGLWFWNVQVSLTIVYHSILFNGKIAKNRFQNKMRKEFNMSWISNEEKHFPIDFFLLLFSQDLCFLVFSGLFPKTPFKICYFLVLIQLFIKGKKKSIDMLTKSLFVEYFMFHPFLLSLWYFQLNVLEDCVGNSFDQELEGVLSWRAGLWERLKLQFTEINLKSIPYALSENSPNRKDKIFH